MSQSSNDTYPTAMHVAILMNLREAVPAIDTMIKSLAGKARQFASFKKIGRTHLMDALPVTLGSEFAAYVTSITKARDEVVASQKELQRVALGGTAVGSGANTPKGYRGIAIAELAKISKLPLRPERDMQHGLQSKYAVARCSGALRNLALETGKVANDIRLMASGPVAGLSEVGIPAVHAGSSIMPGKVNPSLAECMNMVCFNIIGNDTAVAYAATAGQFELNVMLPGMLKCMLESTDMLKNFLPIFSANLIDGLDANRDKLRAGIENSPVIVTLLTPEIGYLKSAELFKESLKTGKTIRETGSIQESDDRQPSRLAVRIGVWQRYSSNSYGCSASFADSEMISGIILNGGHTMAEDAAESDLNVIVTCSVKDATAGKMIHRIKSLNAKPLVVAGCLPKAERGTVEKFSENASMLGPNSLGRTLQVIDSTLKGNRSVALEDTDLSKVGLPKVRLNPAVGIVEIASGCMSECTFCQTKISKGDLQSYRLGDIVRQVRTEIDEGCREIWLTSTDNGCYGFDIGTDLPSLVDAVADIPAEFMIRVGMMNPMYMPRIKKGLIESYGSDKVFKFLHVPVQSGSDRVLHDMKRGHTAGTFREIVGMARKRFPEFTISTDIIVGFPSETREDFERTVELLDETRPDVVNLSRYSARPGTEAATWEQVDVAEVKSRSKAVYDQIRKISLENNKKWIGWKGDVLFDEQTEDGIKGRNYAYKPVFVPEKVDIGQLRTVEITGATQSSLLGQIAS